MTMIIPGSNREVHPLSFDWFTLVAVICSIIMMGGFASLILMWFGLI